MNGIVKILLFPLRLLSYDWSLGTYFKIPVVVTGGFNCFVVGLLGVILFVSDANEALGNVWSMLWRISFAYGLVILHEYGHSLIAQKLGYSVRRIAIHPFAGVATIEGDWYEVPRHEFWISLSGPLVNFMLAFIAWPVYWIWPNPFSLFFLEVNVILLGFNLLPIFPMDGGRIFRSVLVAWMGDVWRATKTTQWVTVIGVILLSPIFWKWSPIAAILVMGFGILGSYGEVHFLSRKIAYRKLGKKKLAEIKDCWPQDSEVMLAQLEKERPSDFVNEEKAQKTRDTFIAYDRWFEEAIVIMMEQVVKDGEKMEEMIMSGQEIEVWLNFALDKRLTSLQMFLRRMDEDQVKWFNAFYLNNKKKATILFLKFVHRGNWTKWEEFVKEQENG